MTGTRIDLHMHSRVSDGTDTPEELLENVKKAGMDIFSLTDHDAAKGCVEIRSLLREGDPVFIPGVEFSCKDEKGKYHILGFGYEPGSDSIEKVVGRGHAFRMKKVLGRIEFLKERFGFIFAFTSFVMGRSIRISRAMSSGLPSAETASVSGTPSSIRSSMSSA